MIELTDKQIKQIALDSETFASEAYKQRPELFRSPFKDGDWIIGEGSLWKIGYKNFVKNNLYDEKFFNKAYEYRLATQYEIKAHLETEFWKRYKVGDTIKCKHSSEIWIIKKDNDFIFEDNIETADTFYICQRNYFPHYIKPCVVYKRGEWAEITKRRITLAEYKEALIKIQGPTDKIITLHEIINTFEKENNLK